MGRGGGEGARVGAGRAQGNRITEASPPTPSLIEREGESESESESDDEREREHEHEGGHGGP